MLIGLILMLIVIVFCFSWPKAIKHSVKVDSFSEMTYLSLAFLTILILCLYFFQYEYGVIFLIIAWAMLLKTLASVVPLYLEFRDRED